MPEDPESVSASSGRVQVLVIWDVAHVLQKGIALYFLVPMNSKHDQIEKFEKATHIQLWGKNQETTAPNSIENSMVILPNIDF